MFFEKFSHSTGLLQKTLILASETNSALSCENETKIVKITHSVRVIKQLHIFFWYLFLGILQSRYFLTINLSQALDDHLDYRNDFVPILFFLN